MEKSIEDLWTSEVRVVVCAKGEGRYLREGRGCGVDIFGGEGKGRCVSAAGIKG